MPAPSGERATLSRDLADFLIELSIALHKHAMYPEGHPSLAPAAAGVTRRAGLLLEDRATLSLGVARQQLVIEGVATDRKSTRLNSSHVENSYAVFCLKKKKRAPHEPPTTIEAHRQHH